MIDTKLYIITYKDKNVERVSHGVGNNSLKNYCLPPEPLEQLKPLYDEEGPYIPLGLDLKDV